MTTLTAPPAVLSSSEAVAEHLGGLRRAGLTTAAVDGHSQALRRLAEFLSPRSLVEATPADVRAFLGYLQQLGVTEKSLHGYTQVFARWTAFVACREGSASSSGGQVDAPVGVRPAPSARTSALDPVLPTPAGGPRPPAAAPTAPVVVAPVVAFAPVASYAPVASPVAAPAVAKPSLLADESAITPSLLADDLGGMAPRAAAPPPAGASPFATGDDLLALKDAEASPLCVATPRIASEQSEFWGGPPAATNEPAPTAAAPSASRPSFISAPLPPPLAGEEEARSSKVMASNAMPVAPAPRGMGTRPAGPSSSSGSIALAGNGAAALAPPPMPQAEAARREAAAHVASGGSSIALALAPTDESVLAIGDAVNPGDVSLNRKSGLPLSGAAWGLRQKRSCRTDLDLVEVRELAKSGHIGPDDLVRKPGGNWVKASHLPLLRDLLRAVPEAAPVPKMGASREADPTPGSAVFGALAGGVVAAGWCWFATTFAGAEVPWATVAFGLAAGLGGRLASSPATSPRVLVAATVACGAMGFPLSRLLLHASLSPARVAGGFADLPGLAEFSTSTASPASLVMLAAGLAAGAVIASRWR